MGNSCKTKKKNEKSKKYFSDKKIKLEDEDEDEEDKKEDVKKEEIKNEEVKNEEVKKGEDKKKELNKIEEKIEKKNEEKDKKKEKKTKVKDEKENLSNDVDNFSEEDITCNLKLEISLSNILNEEKYKVEVYEYKNARKTEKKKIAETELQSAKNKFITFNNDVIIPFHFSQNQPLEFSIAKNSETKSIVVSKTLGEIVGSLRQTYTETLVNDITFEVKAILNDELNKQCKFNIEVSGSLVGMKIGYIIRSLGNQYEPINKKLFESEILENSKQVNFNEALIPISELAVDDNLDDNIIEIEFKDVNHSVELGKFQSSINQLFEKEIDVDLTGNKKAKIICRKKNFHSLLDYLERDLHLATTLFIDFSESGENNLHHLVKEQSTFFEPLMKNFIDILLPYNEDNFFRIYGYGFKPKEEIKGDFDPYKFPINKKIDQPSIKESEINKFYNEFLNWVNFDKQKTNCDLIIKKFNETIKEDIDDYDIREYNILLLFVNNDIIDEKGFIKDLIFSSTLPISIVIVGLGKGPFAKLENIEQNFLSLSDDEGNKPKRKCIKFISFNKKKNYQNTVKYSLIDIPDEMIEYLSIKNIEPSI